MSSSYVAAHTSAVGAHTLTGVNETTISVLGGTPTVSSQAINRAFSYKSPVTSRGFAPGTTFRLPTTYSRIIARIESTSNVDFRSWNGSDYTKVPSFVYKSSSSIRSDFLSMLIKPEWNVGNVTVSSSVVNRAVTEAKLKVQNMYIDVATSLFEAKTTYGMIVDRILSLLKAFRYFRKKQYKKAYSSLFGKKAPKSARKVKPSYAGFANRASKDASSAWLEWWYGWFPLISDIWGGIEQLRNGFREDNLLFSVSRTVTNSIDPTQFFSNTSSNPYITVSGEASESCRCVLWGKVSSSLHAFSALGLINPGAVAWELMPYSFVIDWLIPIGDWLQSLSATAGVTFVAGFNDLLVTCDAEAMNQRPGAGSSNPASRKGQFPKAKVQVMAFRRNVHMEWPWSLPYVKNPFSSNHLITAAALMSQLRK